MNYFVTKYPQGTFSLADLSSTDMNASKKFLTGLFGWTVMDMPTGQPGMDYSMFMLDGKFVAGGMPAMSSTPSCWNSYITVDDVAAMAIKAQKLGAKIIMPTMDVMDAGQMAGIQDPTGAMVMLWQPKKNIGAQVVNAVGAMGWNELYTNDIEKAKKFYADLLGWTYDVDEKSGYAMIQNNGRANGGMMAITKEMMGMPPNWTVYFSVKNLDQSLAKVKELGGQVHMQKTLEVGKVGMITDPTGAGFIIIEMFNPPDEWKE